MSHRQSSLVSLKTPVGAFVVLASILFLAQPRMSGFAGEIAAAVAEEEPKTSSLYDDIWSLATIYKNDENPVLQKLAFTGRAQFEYATIDADQGGYDDWNVRRLRIGFNARLFENFSIQSIAVINPDDGDPAYRRLTDAYLAWSRDPRLKIKIGKQAAQFTLDGHTSSKELITIDRSNLTNNLWYPQEYVPGATVSGKVGAWRYNTGFFSSGEASPEFGNFNAGNFGLLTFGYDFAELLEVKEALLNFDYVYNDPDPGNTFTRSLRQVGSVNFFYDAGKYGFRADATVGDGYLGQSDLFGFLVMPFYNVTEKVQVVGRYTHIGSEDGTNGVRLARYENQVVGGRGDDYNEFYLGLNFYFYGHKLKYQTGVTYAMMDDDRNDGGAYDGWGITTGIRIGW